MPLPFCPRRLTSLPDSPTDYWQNQFPVEPVLRALFTTADERLLTVTDDPEEAVEAITRFEPSGAQQTVG